ncbi:MAG TPA: hypothetical protein VNA25_01570 [Phycisphaerae bacterium]|nr:hypothetical protein [Phycisphaerae bacterium]
MPRTTSCQSTTVLMRTAGLAGIAALVLALTVVPGCEKKPSARPPAAPTPSKVEVTNVPVPEPVQPPAAPNAATTQPVAIKFSALVRIVFICEKCGHQLRKPIPEIDTTKDITEAEMELSCVDCPKCGQKACCWRAIHCPACKKFYISQSEKARVEAMRAGRGEPEGVVDVCPYCRTNLLEWYRKHRRK